MTHPHFNRRDFLVTGAAAGAGLWLPASQAQSAWPQKPLRLVVPFATGGSSEIVARAVAGELAKTIGQSVFVDNKPGAAGNIAMQEVARAEDQPECGGTEEEQNRAAGRGVSEVGD